MVDSIYIKIMKKYPLIFLVAVAIIVFLLVKTIPYNQISEPAHVKNKLSTLDSRSKFNKNTFRTKWQHKYSSQNELNHHESKRN